MHKIYKLTFPGGKCYVGRTEQLISVRMAQHRYDALKRNCNQAIHKAIRKYGPRNFFVEVLNEVQTFVEAVMMESHYIQEYDSVKNGYNNTNNTERGGDVWKERKNEKSYRKFVDKMSHINRGENNGMYGKNHTEEAKTKQKAKAKGRFSLPWFVDRYGESEGHQKYKDRCRWLSERRVARDGGGKFC